MPAPLVPYVAPAVPPFPGVPALLGNLVTIASGAVGIGGGLSVGPGGTSLTPPQALATADSPAVFGLLGQARWGIFGPGGAPILTVDSVASVEYLKDFEVSNYPQERGAFESYNKVERPFLAKVGFLLGPNRAAFLDEVQAWLKTLEFVSIVTPEVSYPSANVTHLSYRRTSRGGVTLILAEVWCEEVRITATTETQASDGKSVNSRPTQPGGAVQTAEGATATTVGAGGLVTTPDGTTPNLVTTLSPPPGATTSTTLTAPNVGPAFYDGTNLAQIPDSWADLTGAQRQTILNEGPQLGAGSVQATSDGGDAVVLYDGAAVY